MPGSYASVFGDPDDFEAALDAQGVVRLLVTERGQFRARLTQIALDRLRLAGGDEKLTRIAFVVAPAGSVLISFPIEGAVSPVWGGGEMRAGEIVTVGPGERVHVRTDGPSRWGVIQVPEHDLVQCGRVLTGPGFVVRRGVARSRPASAAARHLHQFFRAAIRTAEIRSGALADIQAAHGLEQQLMHALVECMWPGPAEEEAPVARRRRNLLARFEELLEAKPFASMAGIGPALGVSDRLLRECCKAQLGMSPGDYRRRRRLQQVHRGLHSGDPESTTVAEIAGRHGFRDLGRFAGNYREVYGELPSATLRRGSPRRVADLALGRPRVKFS